MNILLVMTMLFTRETVEWQEPCATSEVKSYMDYSAVKDTSSRQYKYISSNMTADGGLLYDQDGSIGVALGSWWGEIGSKWIVELDNGTQLKVVKIDEKADVHVDYGCIHKRDKSVIEMVVDSVSAPKSWMGGNGYLFNGNFNNYNRFKGSIKRVGKLATFTETVEIDVSKYFPPQPKSELGFEILENIFAQAPRH